MALRNTSGSVEMIIAFMRSYPGRSAIMLICLLFSGLSEGIGVATLLPLLNITVGQKDSDNSPLNMMTEKVFSWFGIQPSMGFLLILMVAGITLKAGFRLLAMKQVGYTVAYVVTDLRLALLRALMNARWGYFILHPLGIFSNAISTEAIRLSDGYRFACLMMAQMIEVIFYLVIAVLLSWKVTIVSLVIGSVVIFALLPLVRAARRAGVRQTNSFQVLLVRLTDLLKGIKPIKAMGLEGRLSPMLEKESTSLKKALELQVLSSETLRTLHEPIIVFFMAVGIYVVLKTWAVSMTHLLVMAFLFQRTLYLMGKIQKHYQIISVSESAYWSFQKTLHEAESADEHMSGAVVPGLSRGIRFEKVSFAYDGEAIIRDVSLIIPHGKLTVLTGLSGAGKTTIADLLTGLIRPQNGDIFVDDVPLTKIDLQAWRQMIGYVPQEMFLFHESVYTNLTLNGKGANREDAVKALKRAGAWEFVSALPDAMDTILGEHGAKVSGGQRQRIALARALVRNPKLLILDEVTSALDPDTEAAVCRTMLELKGDMTMLAISHQPALIESADLVYRIVNGQVHQVGNG